MCWNAQDAWPMPTETAAVGNVFLDEDGVYRLVGEKIFEKFQDEDFWEMSSNE